MIEIDIKRKTGMFRSFFLIILKFLKEFISHLIYLMQMILFVIGITA